MISSFLIGFVLGLYSLIGTAIFLHYRKDKPMGGVSGFFEFIKWIVWVCFVIMLPVICSEYLENFFGINQNLIGRRIIIITWLFIWVGFFVFWIFREWQRGELVLYNAKGEIVYKGRKKK